MSSVPTGVECPQRRLPSSQKPTGRPLLPFSKSPLWPVFQPSRLLHPVQDFGPARRTPDRVRLMAGGGSGKPVPKVDGTTPRTSPGAPGAEKRRFVTGERLPSDPPSVDTMEASSQRPSITKDSKSSDSLSVGSGNLCLQRQQDQPETKGRFSKVTGTETDTGIPGWADNEL